MPKIPAKKIAEVILNRNPLDLVTAFHATGGHRIAKPSPAKRKWHDEHQELHHHKLELQMVLDGQEDYGLNGKIYRLTPGTILLANFGDFHDGGQDPDNYGTFLYLILYQHDVLWFTIQIAPPPHSGAKPQPGVMTILHIPTDLKQVEQIKSSWHDAVNTKGLARKLAIHKLAFSLHLLFLNATQFYLSHKEKASRANSSPPHVAVQLVKEYLDSGLGKDISIKKLALLAGYSASHFQPLFKRIIGCTVHEYIDKLRIEHLRLYGKKQPKKVLAIDLGFKSLSAFSRWHRKNPEEKLVDSVAPPKAGL